MNKHLSEAADVTEEVSDKAVKGLKQVGKMVQKCPYKTIGLVLGVGALIGLVIYYAGSKNGVESDK
jgi:ElaB/YqjD/DUF883 family membrane-anchored ribosome-binding protein